MRVLESQPQWHSEPRTLIVTPAWLRMLDFDVEEAVLNRTATFELISRRASTRVQLREPDVVLDRACFLSPLAQRVESAGGQVLLGHRFEELELEAAFPLVRFRNGRGLEETPASTLIGADGVYSTVARQLARATGAQRHPITTPVSIWQARVRLPADLPPDTVRCWFDRHTTRFFYWLIPESPQTGAVGLIADDAGQAQRALERFIAAQDLEPLEYQQALVPLYAPRWSPRCGLTARIGRGRALLVGDAAGQVKVTTVGGGATGMRGGAAAARSIVRGTSYKSEARSLRRELQAHAALRFLLDGFADEDYDWLLRLLNGPSKRVLRHYNRDHLRRSIWRLILAQPRWVTLAPTPSSAPSTPPHTGATRDCRRKLTFCRPSKPHPRTSNNQPATHNLQRANTPMPDTKLISPGLTFALRWGPVLACMGAILFFSSQARPLGPLGDTRCDGLAGRLAHIGEYAVLSLLL